MFGRSQSGFHMTYARRMRRIIAVLTASLAVQIGTAQSDPGFSGLWKLNPARSEVRNLPVPPDPFLKVSQSAAALTILAGSGEDGPFTSLKYPLDGTAQKRQVGGSSNVTQ